MYYIDEIKNKQKYINAIILAFVFVFAVFIIGVLFEVGPTVKTVRSDVYEGTIMSSDGVVLTELRNKDSSNLITAHAASLTYPKEYSALLGYNAPVNGMSGLRARYSDYLYEGKNGDTGNTLTLTINHDLQKYCYNVLSSYNKNGSIVVMNTDTGEIEALVSYKKGATYDANKIDQNYSEWSSISEFFYPEWQLSKCPGSTFKIVSGLGILESGKEKYKYKDTTGYIEINDKKIKNANAVAYGEMTLTEALKFSANVYFVKLYNEVVDFKYLNKAAESFLIGSKISTDFGVLKSNWDVNKDNESEVAQTSFGQGKTEVTPVHEAMIISSVVNGGKLLRPYVVADNLDKGLGEKIGSIFKKGDGKTEVITRSMSKSDAKAMRKMLSNNAQYYGMGENYYAKSGTAEIVNNDVQSWIVAANDNHAVVISIKNAGYGMGLAKNAKAVIDKAEAIFKAEDK